MHFGSGQYTPYTLQIDEYIKNLGINESDEDVKRVRAALVNIQNKMSQKINQLTSDPTISMCLKGRDMKQIRGNRTRVKKNADGTDMVDEEGKAITESDNQTEGRYPHLLDEKMEKIFAAALNKAEENYGKQYEEMLSEAMKNADETQKKKMCNLIASNVGLRCDSGYTKGVCHKYGISSVRLGFFNQSSGQSKENGVRETFNTSATGIFGFLGLIKSINATSQGYSQTWGPYTVGSVIVTPEITDGNTCKITIDTYIQIERIAGW